MQDFSEPLDLVNIYCEFLRDENTYTTSFQTFFLFLNIFY